MRQSVKLIKVRIVVQRGTGMCIKGLFGPPLEPKTENCFSSTSFDWLFGGISEV